MIADGSVVVEPRDGPPAGGLVEAALGYCDIGFALVPLWWPQPDGSCACPRGERCDFPGKHPMGDLVPGGFNDASAEPEVVRRWFEARPNANVGFNPGRSGHVVLDIDPRNGGDVTWVEDVPRFTADTPCSATGGGGKHVIFRQPDEMRFRKGALGLGIDVISNGLVVLPPSIHRSGLRYEWVADPSSTPATELPRQLAEAMRRTAERSKPRRRTAGQRPAGHERTTMSVSAGVVGRVLIDVGLVEGDPESSVADVLCPWRDEHSGEQQGNAGSSVVFGPKDGASWGYFYCAHSHCQHRTWRDVRARFPAEFAAAVRALKVGYMKRR